MILENLDLNSLLKKLDEENQIWYSGDTMFVPFNVYFITWKDIEEKAKGYDNIFFTTSEWFLNGELIPTLKTWVDEGKKIFFRHFTFGYGKYLKKIINSDNIITPDLDLAFFMAHETGTNMKNSYADKVHNSNYKKILLNYLTYNRSLHKDYVFDKIILYNELHLDNRNLISYHNFKGHHDRNTPENLKKYSWFYDRPEHRDFIKNFSIDLDKLTDFKLIPESENFDIKHQRKQKDRLCEIHNATMFNIVSEACMPYSNDVENIWYYHASFSAKSIWPLYFKNVFYHAPNCKIFNEALEELGFKTFFVNDSQFLQAMNEDYYYNHEVQEKLFHNHMHIQTVIDGVREKYNINKGDSPNSWIKNYIIFK